MEMNSLLALPGGVFGPRPGVPDLHGAVRVGRSEAVAVGAEGNAEDALAVAFECKHFLAAVHVPELDGPIPTGRGQPPAIRAEDDAAHVAGVA